MKPHKHKDLIIAWAEGAVIERMWAVNDEGKGWWLIDNEPDWNEFDEYRIKPEPKADVVCVEYAEFNFDSDDWIINSLENKKNLRLTFDGKTGKLKSAEVLK